MGYWRVFGRFKIADRLRVIVEVSSQEDEKPGPTTEHDVDAYTGTAEALRQLMIRLRRLSKKKKEAV